MQANESARLGSNASPQNFIRMGATHCYQCTVQSVATCAAALARSWAGSCGGMPSFDATLSLLGAIKQHNHASVRHAIDEGAQLDVPAARSQPLCALKNTVSKNSSQQGADCKCVLGGV